MNCNDNAITINAIIIAITITINDSVVTNLVTFCAFLSPSKI